MPRFAIPAFVAVAVLATGLVALAAGLDERRVAFSLGVSPDEEVVRLGGDREVCQRPIAVSETFQAIGFEVDRTDPTGPPLRVRVFSADERALLASGTLPAGYRDGPQGVELSTPAEGREGSVPEGTIIEVCLSALGGGARPSLRGGPAKAARTSDALLNLVSTKRDVTLVFLRDRPRSVLSLVPSMLERASLWRPGLLSPGLLSAVLGLAVLGAGALLGRALSLAGRG